MKAGIPGTALAPSALDSRHLHRSSGGTSPSTCSTWSPHPTKVGFPQLGQSTRVHILSHSPSSSGLTALPAGTSQRARKGFAIFLVNAGAVVKVWPRRTPLGEGGRVVGPARNRAGRAPERTRTPAAPGRPIRSG